MTLESHVLVWDILNLYVFALLWQSKIPPMGTPQYHLSTYEDNNKTNHVLLPVVTHESCHVTISIRVYTGQPQVRVLLFFPCHKRTLSHKSGDFIFVFILRVVPHSTKHYECSGCILASHLRIFDKEIATCDLPTHWMEEGLVFIFYRHGKIEIPGFVRQCPLMTVIEGERSLFLFLYCWIC
jgi:hypothetical protein